MNWLPFLLLLAYVVIDATAQGKIAWLTREWVPPTAQSKVSFALHWLYPSCYALLAGALCLYTHRWEWLAVALLLRVAAFDPVFVWSRGDKLFSIGTSARLDQLIARLAGARAPLLSAILRVAALLLAGAAAWVATN